MGFMTNLLNPKVAMFYLSFFPQFLHPERGDLLRQSLTLGLVQISVSTSVNTVLICFAAAIAGFLNRNLSWMRVQRYVMGTVLGLLALRLLAEKRAAA
jgi:threonine/homoserine/homoserine lactone efflux protein